jgi:hypothetical protein
MKQFILSLLLVGGLQAASGQLERNSSSTTQTATTTIDIEPEECVVRCFFIRGVPVFCYEVCF